MLEPASKLNREEERVKGRERSCPFLLGAPKNALLYNQKHAPNISQLPSLASALGMRVALTARGAGRLHPKQRQGRKFCSTNGWVET